MPGRSWRNLAPQTRSADVNRSQPFTPTDVVEQVRGQSSALDALLEQRRELEDRMRLLSGGGQAEPSARDAARYQVQSFAQRRAQQREWERERDARRIHAVQNRRQQSHEEPQPAVPESHPTNAGRSGRRTPTSEVDRWLMQRDGELQGQRSALRSRIQPIDRMGRQLSGLTDRFRQVDRQIPENREGTRDSLRDKLREADHVTRSVNRMIDTPTRAVERVDRFWSDRERTFTAPMDDHGGYAQRSRDRLSVDRGGSGDLFERMERNRERSAERLRQRRVQQQRNQRDEEQRDQRQREERRMDRRPNDSDSDHGRDRALARRREARASDARDQARRDRAVQARASRDR